MFANNNAKSYLNEVQNLRDPVGLKKIEMGKGSQPIIFENQNKLLYEKIYTLFVWSSLDIWLTIINYVTTCQRILLTAI